MSGLLARASCSKQVHLSSAFSWLIFHSASSFAGQSLTYSLYSAKIFGVHLKWSVNRSPLKTKITQGCYFCCLWSLPKIKVSYLYFASHLTPCQKVWTAEPPSCIRVLPETFTQPSCKTAICVHWQGWPTDADISKDLLFQYNTDIVNIIPFLWLLWNNFSSSPSKLPRQQWTAPVFQPKWAVSS